MTDDLAPSYQCADLPAEQMSNVDIVAFYRDRVGSDVVNEQIAVMGADRVIESMQRAHRSHLLASVLTEAELHQRAEMMESLMLEFGVPERGQDPEVLTDLDRVQMFIRVVKGIADVAAEAQMRDEALHHVDYSVVDSESSSRAESGDS
jgi:hypothetical protein